MKNLLLIILVTVGITSCSNEPEVEQTTESVSNDNYMKFEYGNVDEYHIQEIDGCEYILVNGSDNHEPAITHKGNCKYCMERNETLIKDIDQKEVEEY